jgi:hypothetical protein
MQATGEQLSRGSEQLYDATRSAGQEFAQEFQNWAGSAVQDIAPIGTYPRNTASQTSSGRGQVSNPFVPAQPEQPTMAKSRNGVAPPPWAGSSPTTEPDWASNSTEPVNIERMAALGAGPAQPDSGWTSLRADLAPPALLLPQLANSTDSGATRQQAGSTGPGFPNAFGNPTQPDRAATMQSRQSPTATAAEDDWALGWGTNATQPATIGRYESPTSSTNGQTGEEHVSAAPAAARPQNSPNTSRSGQSQSFDPWGDNDPWAEPVNSPAGAAHAAAAATNVTAPSEVSSAQAATDSNTHQPVGPAAVQPNQGAEVPSMATAGGAVAPPVPPVIANAQPVAAKPGDEPPWVPLLVVSLSLAGSLGANLFLGWSYMDARQKYRVLVQKTANTFRRATAAA